MAAGRWRHAMMGRVYVAAMLVANITALASYRPGTPLIVFDVLAVIGLASLGQGVLGLRRWLRTRDPAALRSHQTGMAYSWLGLAMAGVSQPISNPRFGIAAAMTPTEFWMLLAGVNIVLYAVGSWWLFARLLRAPAPASVR